MTAPRATGATSGAGERLYPISPETTPTINPTAIDLNVAISAPAGFNATVSQVKQKGPQNVKLKTSGYLGPTTDIGDM
jgi:hypothetical protein